MPEFAKRVRKPVRLSVHPVAHSEADNSHLLRNWPGGGPVISVTYVAIDKIKPRERKVRKHTTKSVAQIEASIRQFGFTQPILVDGDRNIIAGYGRWLAAQNLKMAEVPVVQIEHLSDAEIRALVIADNKIAEKSGWDADALKLEIGDLAAMDLSFDLEVTGFGTVEIDNLTIGDTPVSDPADEAPVPPDIPVSRSGDLFLLGQHKLICGDSRDPATYALLMSDERARMVFSDNPYNLKVGSIVGLGKVQHAEFAMASGEMPKPEFTSFLTTVFKCLAAVSVDGAIHFQCIDWKHLGEMQAAGDAAYTELKNVVCWVKDNGGMGAFYRSQHELIFVWKVGKAPHTNTFGLGGGGRYRTNCWTYPGVNSLRRGRMEDLAAHPTVKPIALVADAIRDVSKRGEIVLDPFLGSGTTILAAERTGRVARGVEIEPKFVDVAIGRWEKMTGKEAVLEATGQTFTELTAERAFLDEDAA